MLRFERKRDLEAADGIAERRPRHRRVEIENLLRPPVRHRFEGVRVRAACKRRALDRLPARALGSGNLPTRVSRRGARTVIAPRFTPEGFVEDVRRHRASIVFLVPTQVHRFLAVRPAGLDSLRAVIVAGAPFPPALTIRNYFAKKIGGP